MAQLCVMCKTTEAKYKCPTCRVPYCSLVCCKEHKETPCEPVVVPPETPQEPPTSAPIVLSEDKEMEKLPADQLALLRTSPKVHELLTDPVIMNVLTQIQNSQDKTKTLEKALLNPAFAKFMYHALDEIVPAKSTNLTPASKHHLREDFNRVE